MAVEFVREYFLKRSIDLFDDWLNLCIAFLLQQKKFVTNEELVAAVFEQWLYTNLKLSTQPSLKIKSENDNFRFSTNFYLQIDSLVDIGSSFYTQYNRFTLEFDDNSGFESVSNEENDKPRRYESESRRMLLLLLSDGNSVLKAIEFEPMKQLSIFTLPGCKIFIDSKAVCRKNVLFLTDKNCLILGGDDETLAKTGRPLEIICYQLGKTKSRKKCSRIVESKETVLDSRKRSNSKDTSLLSVNNLHFPYSRGASCKNDIVQNNVNCLYTNKNQERQASRIDDRKRHVKLDSTDYISSVSSIQKEGFNKNDSDKKCISSTSVGNIAKAAGDQTRSEEECEIIYMDNELNRTGRNDGKAAGQVGSSDLISTSDSSITTRFIETGVMYIAEILKSMRFVIGSRCRLISAVMIDVDEPLKIEDDMWSMSIVLADESCSRLRCVVAHSVLEQLIGLTPKEAEAVRCSSNKARRKEGTLRLKSVQESMERLDLIWEVEFHSNADFVPIVKNIATFAQRLQIFD